MTRYQTLFYDNLTQEVAWGEIKAPTADDAAYAYFRHFVFVSDVASEEEEARVAVDTGVASSVAKTVRVYETDDGSKLFVSQHQGSIGLAYIYEVHNADCRCPDELDTSALKD